MLVTVLDECFTACSDMNIDLPDTTADLEQYHLGALSDFQVEDTPVSEDAHPTQVLERTASHNTLEGPLELVVSSTGVTEAIIEAGVGPVATNNNKEPSRADSPLGCRPVLEAPP